MDELRSADRLMTSGGLSCWSCCLHASITVRTVSLARRSRSCAYLLKGAVIGRVIIDLDRIILLWVSSVVLGTESATHLAYLQEKGFRYDRASTDA